MGLRALRCSPGAYPRRLGGCERSERNFAHKDATKIYDESFNADIAYRYVGLGAAFKAYLNFSITLFLVSLVVFVGKATAVSFNCGCDDRAT